MKINIRTKALFLGATILGTILFASVTASAQNIIQNLSQSGAGVGGGNGDWDSMIWGAGNLAPTSGNTYETPSGFFVRTDNNTPTTVPPAFAGNSLQIDSGGTLYLKNTSSGTNPAVAVVNLVSTGGSILFHGGGNTGNSVLGGTLLVSDNSSITTDQTGSNLRNIWLQSSISGSGSLTFTAENLGSTYGLLLSGNNSAYSGGWTDLVGYIEIVSGTTNALGSGPVTLSTANGVTQLIIYSTNNMVINNAISGGGSVLVTNTNTVVLGGANTFTGSIVISSGTVQIGAGSSLTSASVISLTNKGTLDASLVGGLTLNPAGQIMTNCNGTVISNLTVSGSDALNFNIASATNDILNVTGSLTLTGGPILSLTQPGYVPSGVYRLINYSGTIQGDGTPFTLVTPPTSSETYQLFTNTPGQVNLMVTGITYNLIWVGDGSANNWDTTSPNWSGATNLFALGDNVTFNDSGSANPAINIDSAIVAPGTMAINNTANYYTFMGYGITTSGSLTKMGTNEVDFASAGDAFSGPISIQAGILSIGNGGTTGSLGTGTITNNGVLQVNLSTGGAAFNAPISGSGSLNITGGGASVTIGAQNSYSGGTTIGNGCQLGISTSSALGSGAATVLANGRLGVTTAVGSMTVTNPLVINGYYESPGGALYVNTSGNNVTWSGPISITNTSSLNQFRVVNVNTEMNISGTVLGTNVGLECTAGNTAADETSVMIFSNTVSLGSGGSMLVDGLAVVVLAGNSNVWGGGTTVGYNGASPFVSSSTATLLVNGTLNGGALEVENLATLGGTGVVLDPVTVDGSVAPGPVSASIGTLTISNSVMFNSDGSAVMEINRGSSPNASHLAATSVNFGGSTLTVNNIGSTNLQAGDTFTLFTGAISGTFGTTNLPALPSPNLYWILNGGVLQVASSTPIITSPAISGTNFTLQVAMSLNGSNYVLLESTNVALPIMSWTPVLTNVGTGGTINFTTPIIPGNRQMFYCISVP